MAGTDRKNILELKISDMYVVEMLKKNSTPLGQLAIFLITTKTDFSPPIYYHHHNSDLTDDFWILSVSLRASSFSPAASKNFDRRRRFYLKWHRSLITGYRNNCTVTIDHSDGSYVSFPTA